MNRSKLNGIKHKTIRVITLLVLSVCSSTYFSITCIAQDKSIRSNTIFDEKNNDNNTNNFNNEYIIGDKIKINYICPLYDFKQRCLNKLGTFKTIDAGVYNITDIYDKNVVKLNDLGWVNLDYNVNSIELEKNISISQYAIENENLAPDDGKKYKDFFNDFYPLPISSDFPWCAAYVSYIGHEIGYSNLIPPLHYPEPIYNYYKSRKVIMVDIDSFEPKQDMLVFFDWESDGIVDHIGIVDFVDTYGDSIIKRVNTIEGNITLPSIELHTSGKSNYNLDNPSIVGYVVLGGKDSVFNDEKTPLGALILFK